MDEVGLLVWLLHVHGINFKNQFMIIYRNSLNWMMAEWWIVRDVLNPACVCLWSITLDFELNSYNKWLNYKLKSCHFPWGVRQWYTHRNFHHKSNPFPFYDTWAVHQIASISFIQLDSIILMLCFISVFLPIKRRPPFSTYNISIRCHINEIDLVIQFHNNRGKKSHSYIFSLFLLFALWLCSLGFHRWCSTLQFHFSDEREKLDENQ